VNVFFGYGEQQDLKDATKQIAFIQQGGLGLPEKDYYLRTGDKDVKIREQYVAHVAKMLTLAGSTPEQAQKDAQNILAMETALAKASLGVVDMREPEKTYHLQPIATLRPPARLRLRRLRRRHSTRPASPRSTTPHPTTGPR
jgi:putative endopeptidase